MSTYSYDSIFFPRDPCVMEKNNHIYANKWNRIYLFSHNDIPSNMIKKGCSQTNTYRHPNSVSIPFPM